MTALVPRRALKSNISTRWIGVALACGTAAGFLGLVAGPAAVGALACIGLVAISAYRPIFATYAYLLTLPFIAGLGRDTLIPLLRPNEALLALLLLGAGLGAYARILPWRPGGGAPFRFRLRSLDPPLIAFALLSTAWPVASLMLRGIPPQQQEIIAVAPVCKLVALLLLVRWTVRSERQLVRCMRLIVWPAAGTALIATLQTLNVPPVMSALAALWSADFGIVPDRGTATLGSPIATGDYIVIGLAMTIFFSARGMLGRQERLLLGLVLSAGALATGQFSTWIAAAVAGVVVLSRMPGSYRKVLRLVPIAGVAFVLGAPALLSRLSAFAAGELPQSWQVRGDNIAHFYLPKIADFGFVLGVSPNSVLPAPETWREVIDLESGYLHLLWVGGIPLLAAFGWLSVVVLRGTAQLRVRGDAIGAYASTLEAAWWVILVLSLIDIHLVMRGVGDLIFVLLAIVSARLGVKRDV